MFAIFNLKVPFICPSREIELENEPQKVKTGQPPQEVNQLLGVKQLLGVDP